MNIIIRTDSSFSIGTGHLIRCITLSDALKNKGCNVHFVCRNLSGNINHILEERGDKLYKLSKPLCDFVFQPDDPEHAEWLGVSWQQDLQETLHIIQQIGKQIDWLIVDSYALDYRWENAVRPYVKKIMVVDDLADRKHDCDILLDQNYFAQPDQRYKDIVPESCRLVLGPKYSLLREEFRLARQFCQMRNAYLNRIAVYFGGNDHDNLTGMVLEALTLAELNHIALDLIVGIHNAHLKTLEIMAEKRGKTRIHVQPEAFVELLLRADLFIGAGGTITWERLCLNLPGIVITTALNQESFTAELHRDGFLHWLGRKQDITVEMIKHTVLDYLAATENNNKHGKLYPCFRTGSDIVDAMGALRIAELLVPSSVQELNLRFTDLSDLDIYFSWVNEKITRQYALSSGYIKWKTHQEWFKKSLNDPARFMWILETKNGLPIGQVRFDLHGQIAEVDYSLDPLVRGRGWAKVLLTKGMSALKSLKPDYFVRAKVKSENISSCKTFQSLGFQEKVDGGERLFFINCSC